MDNTKIVVIDDDVQITDTLSKLFAARGGLVSVANTFEDGVAAIQKDQPHLAVVDIMLGDKSGLELVKLIKSTPGPHPYFVVLTNSMSPDHIAEAMEADVTTFIQKADHDPHEIVEMIAKRLNESGLKKE